VNARDDGKSTGAATPSLDELQHWTWVIGRAQQMMLEQGMDLFENLPTTAFAPMFEPAAAMQAGAEFWTNSMQLWQQWLDPAQASAEESPRHARDKRFRAEAWHNQPLFDFLRRSYFTLADRMLDSVDSIEGLDPKQKAQLRFMTQGFVDAISPSNFPGTNPEVLDAIIETRGENLLKGLGNMLADLGKGQLTQSDPDAFEVGRDLATTPGKVVKRTDLYELIQYAPTTEQVHRTPVVIFPPWINRYYILDLTPEKSFIRWAVAQGLTVFVVSWRSADASMKDVVWDDYVARGQIDAIDTVRDLLDVESVHAIGYCVAGTTLAATLAVLAARGEADKVASATFFTAQVDFSNAGDLNLFVDDEQLALIRSLSPDGFLDGRYMAATFNLLRGRDLIWSYVTNNYLLGKDYAPFELLHWNSDVTNLPAAWHLSYLTDLYRDNRLVQPGSLSIGGTPVDLSKVRTPSYIQAGREDHIAPAASVWKLTEHFAGPVRFVLAGSGHIAGVVNPPSSGKYQYWTNARRVKSLESFVKTARETPGSWWPDWAEWVADRDPEKVPATGARIPGKGKLKPLGDAPGSYVKAR
jgi:polyhydroxyalkanoate synthase subunit PhaC